MEWNTSEGEKTSSKNYRKASVNQFLRVWQKFQESILDSKRSDVEQGRILLSVNASLIIYLLRKLDEETRLTILEEMEKSVAGNETAYY